MHQPNANLRANALTRITDYSHPTPQLVHQPINPKECEELQQQLRELVRQKVERVKREYETQDYSKNYPAVYEEFVRMTVNNEAAEKRNCHDIKEMHEMADLLMHPPPFGNDLYLASKQQPSPIEQEELDRVYAYYQRLHREGGRKEESEASQAIRRAKQFVLSDS